MCDQGRGPKTLKTPPRNPPFSPVAGTRIISSYLSLRSDTTNHHIKHNRPLNNMMDVTFVLEESGVTATVEVPCEADVAAAKEVACTALAVSPASVEMRIGTQVLEGTCRLQDTAFDAGVQVVLARCFADIKCPAEYSAPHRGHLSLSRCGTLCVYCSRDGHVGGFDTETFDTVFSFEAEKNVFGPPAISQCKTRCYLACGDCLLEVALPGGEVVRKVDCALWTLLSCGSVVVFQGKDCVSVYDEDLTLLRSLSHQGCCPVALSDCGGWVLTSSHTEKNVHLWDVNTGEAVACVPVVPGSSLALSRSASVFAVASSGKVQLFDWSGAPLRSIDVGWCVCGMQFTPCGKYLVVKVQVRGNDDGQCPDSVHLHQYDVTTMSCVRVIPQTRVGGSFAILPCSRVVVSFQPDGIIVTRHLYPHNSE